MKPAPHKLRQAQTLLRLHVLFQRSTLIGVLQAVRHPLQTKPSLGTVATSNSYNDLDDLPSIPSALSDFSLTEAHILVGNTSGVASDVAVSGDATITYDGVVTVVHAGNE